MLMERARKDLINIEQLTFELAAERENTKKMENTKMMLEKQNMELKVKLEEVEDSNRVKVKAVIATLESNVSKLEEQISAEAQERMLEVNADKKLEKKIKQILMQLEDERRHAEQYKEQNEKTNGNMKAICVARWTRRRRRYLGRRTTGGTTKSACRSETPSGSSTVTVPSTAS